MSTRSIVSASAAALLLTGAAAALAAPAQAQLFPGGWFGDKTFVCSSTDHAGAPLPDVTVKASNEVGAAYLALQELGPLGPQSSQMRCLPQ